MEENQQEDLLDKDQQEEKNQEETDVVDTTKEDYDKLYDQHLRLQAEYQNYRRRTELEKSKIYQHANERFLEDLLPVLDDFERAMALFQNKQVSAESVQGGLELIEKGLRDFLAREGVEPIKALDQIFDPRVHHAVLIEEVEGLEEERVCEELQKGYTLGDKVLRPSMVKVQQS